MSSADEAKTKKFLITGGHLTPALAVIRELKDRGYEKLVFVGRKKSMQGDENYSAEYRVIAEDLNIPFVNIATGKVVRPSDWSEFVESVINFVKLPLGFIHAFFILAKHRPSSIISFGGYIAVPIVIIGRFLGIPAVTHEQTVVSGIANKLIARFSKKILVSWEDSLSHFPHKKTVLTGNPVRKEVLASITSNFKINEDLPTIYVTGGNQGSHIINKTVLEVIEKLLESYNVVHQTGITTVTGDYETCQAMERLLMGKTKGTYVVKGNIFGAEIGEVFEKADIVISRSGANIVTDLLALGKVAILIPIPWSLNNEQMLNAKMLEEIGLGIILQQKDLSSGKLLETIERASAILQAPDLASRIGRAKAMIKPDADKKIVDEILKAGTS